MLDVACDMAPGGRLTVFHSLLPSVKNGGLAGVGWGREGSP